MPVFLKEATELFWPNLEQVPQLYSNFRLSFQIHFFILIKSLI
jgi:hypothetical protein